ncbi:hypothetical protein HTG_19055 [Natrinema mahii]|nr:hypothetical protein HTG_19055 [Natrinema mahii]
MSSYLTVILGRSDRGTEGVVTDMEVEEVMRKMLGHYQFRLDDALPEAEA